MCHPVVSHSRMLCIIVCVYAVSPCSVFLTRVGLSVHGLQIESCYNIIFVSSDIEQPYILV